MVQTRRTKFPCRGLPRTVARPYLSILVRRKFLNGPKHYPRKFRRIAELHVLQYRSYARPIATFVRSRRRGASLSPNRWFHAPLLLCSRLFGCVLRCTRATRLVGSWEVGAATLCLRCNLPHTLGSGSAWPRLPEAAPSRPL